MSYGATGWAADGPPPGFEIKNENALLNLSGIPNAPTQLPAAALLTVGGAGNPNQAFQWWWWYRLQGGTRELAVNGMNPVWTPNAQGNMVSAPFALPATLASTMEWTVFGLGGTSAMVNGILTVRNNGLAPVTLSVFNYLDLDLGGTKNDDGATEEAKGQPRLLIGDPVWIARYRGNALGFFAFEVMRSGVLGTCSPTSTQMISPTRRRSSTPRTAIGQGGSNGGARSLPARRRASR